MSTFMVLGNPERAYSGYGRMMVFPIIGGSGAKIRVTAGQLGDGYYFAELDSGRNILAHHRIEAESYHEAAETFLQDDEVQITLVGMK